MSVSSTSLPPVSLQAEITLDADSPLLPVAHLQRSHTHPTAHVGGHALRYPHEDFADSHVGSRGHGMTGEVDIPEVDEQ